MVELIFETQYFLEIYFSKSDLHTLPYITTGQLTVGLQLKHCHFVSRDKQLEPE